MDPYRVLQVDPAAEPEIIEAAYRRLARMYHPDIYRGQDADSRMRDINAAFSLVGAPKARRSHDRMRSRIETKRARPIAPRVPPANALRGRPPLESSWGRPSPKSSTSNPLASTLRPGESGRLVDLRGRLTSRSVADHLRFGAIAAIVAIGLAGLAASAFEAQERPTDDRGKSTVVVVESRPAALPTALAYARPSPTPRAEFPPTLSASLIDASDMNAPTSLDWIRRLIDGRPCSARIAGPRSPERLALEPIIAP